MSFHSTGMLLQLIFPFRKKYKIVWQSTYSLKSDYFLVAADGATIKQNLTTSYTLKWCGSRISNMSNFNISCLCPNLLNF